MSYTSDELLAGVGLIFESVRSMEGVEFDLGELQFNDFPSTSRVPLITVSLL
jgi:hypothetical protein